MNLASRGLEHALDILCISLKALFIIRLASQPGNRHNISPGPCRQRKKQQANEAQPTRRLHTIPHLRRRNHSEKRSKITRKKMIGMSQSSFVSRIVIPAAEYGISAGSFEMSDAVQYLPPVCDASCSSSARFCSVWKFSATPSSRWKGTESLPSSCPARCAVISAMYEPGWSAVKSA